MPPAAALPLTGPDGVVPLESTENVELLKGLFENVMVHVLPWMVLLHRTCSAALLPIGASDGFTESCVPQLLMVTCWSDHATAQEVVAKVREAASTLSKTGDLAQFNQKQGPWVWKDSYIFVDDCDKMVVGHNFVPNT